MDIQGTLLCDWPSIWIFQLHSSMIGLLSGYSSWTALCFAFQSIWIFKLASSETGILPGYSSWFSKDCSSYPVLCWSISYNLNKAVLFYDGVLPGYLRCPPLWLVGWGQSLNCFLSWRVPGNTILVKKPYARENVDVDLMFIFYVPFFTPYSLHPSPPPSPITSHPYRIPPSPLPTPTLYTSVI